MVSIKEVSNIASREYWGKPEATKKEFTSDGWFRTGDTSKVGNKTNETCSMGVFQRLREESFAYLAEPVWTL